MKWLVGLFIISSSLFSDVIAIASDGDTLNSNVSSQASRCDYYILIDKNGHLLETLQNANKDIRGGASAKLVDLLRKKKVSHFIASSLGDKLIMSLNSENIKYTIFKGDINTFIKQVSIK